MKVLKGHLTSTNKRHILAVLSANLTEAKVNTINYKIIKENGIYTVFMARKDNSIVIGEKINRSKAIFKF